MQVKVKVSDDSALTVSEEGFIVADARFVAEVPTYAPVIFPLLVPVFLITTLMVVLEGQDTFSLTSITPACCVCVDVNVMTQA